MKKILSLVLVAAMMLSMVALAPSASADTGVSIEVTDAVATKGETVTLDYIITGTGLRSFGLLIDFDETRLENPVITVNTDDNLASAKTIGGYPFADATVTSAVDGATIDISGGYKLGTITLTVKEDAPAGDAYIRFNPSPGNNIFVLGTSDVKDKVYDWEVIEGTVTVLPDGYSKAPAVPGDELWDFDPETGTIYAYLGEELSGDIAIPSQIGGVDVVEIYADGESVIDGFEVTSIVVPATVQLISAGAFLNLASCTAIYVLNPDCEIEDTAMGYDGSWRRSKLTVTGQTLDADENTLLTLYGYADSTAQTYAETGDGEYPFGWVVYDAPTTVTVVAGETTSFEVSADSIKAPGTSRVDGKSVIAWQVGEDVYAPGAEVAIDGNTTFTAITAPTPVTVHGASIKAAEGYAALRFTAEFSIDEYEALVAVFGAKNVKHGMLISTQDQIEAAGGSFTHDLAKKIDFAMDGCYKKENGNYVLAASVKNFSDSTLANNYKFNAVAYVGIDLDGNGTVDTYVYGDYNWNCAKDAKTVLTNAITDVVGSGLVGDQITWAENWLAKFN